MSAPPLPSVAGGAHSTYQPLDALAGQGGAARAAEVHEIEAKGAQVHMADLFGITIKIISAQDLMAKDLFTRSSDPYVKITITDQAGEVQQRKTQVIKKNLAPEWDETFTFVFQAVPKSIKFEVKDWDKLGPSSPLGENTLSVEKIGLVDGVTYAGDLRLEGKNIKKGSLKVFIEGLPIPNVVGRSSNELSGVKKVEDIVSLIDLKVCGASALGTHNHAVFKVKNDPFATVSFGLHKFRTAVVPDTNDPTWDQLCPLWITTSDHNASAVLKISVWDHERLGKAVLIGNAYLKPSTLQANHLYDVKLPLVLEDAANDAQLTVLLQDLNVHHSPAPAAASPSAAVSPNPSGKPSVASPTEAIASAASPYGSVHVTFTVKPREQVESDFYSHMIHDYDTDGSNSMDLGEIAHMLTTIGSHLTQEEIETAFKEVDTEKKGALGVAQLAQLFRTAVFEKKAVLRTLYAVMVYGKAAFDSLLMKGVLQGSNSNLAPDADPTVDNEGTKIMVQDRESGMVVAENIPSYIKSALVLLNRSWAGKLAHNKLKGTIRKLTIRQGRKMNDPKSKADIPNFVRIHRLNLAEVELPLEQYQTFNQFFSRRLKPGARTCFAEGDNSYAVSPADCRMMAFRSIEESRALWIKGEKFNVSNLFAGWDTDGKMSSKFNGAELVIARLAPQDYHRFHYPVTGEVKKRFLIQGDYNTVNPIAIRKDVNVYTENKRCVCPIETKEFGLVLLIAIAATMVGTIGFDCTCPVESRPADSLCCEDGRCQVGKQVKKFDDCGWFQFGGSTTLLLFQAGTIEFDSDLLKNSGNQLETLVQVGASLGKATGRR